MTQEERAEPFRVGEEFGTAALGSVGGGVVGGTPAAMAVVGGSAGSTTGIASVGGTSGSPIAGIGSVGGKPVGSFGVSGGCDESGIRKATRAYLRQTVEPRLVYRFDPAHSSSMSVWPSSR